MAPENEIANDTRFVVSPDTLPTESFQPKRTVPVGKYIRRTILYLLLILAILWSVLPLAFVFISSIKPDKETYAFYNDRQLLPKEPTLENYESLFEVTPFETWLKNSTILASATTVLVLIFSALAAYSLSRFNFWGFEAFTRMTLMAYMLPPIILIVPLFLVLRQLGLFNSLFGLLLVYTATRLPFGIWLLRSYFLGIPIELENAAMVDGATRFQAFYKVILPQAFPGMISTGIFVFSVTWHEYLFASILLFSGEKQTLSTGVATFIGEDWIPSWGRVMAAGVLISLPLVIFYTFLQRYLVAGWGGGAVKG